MLSFPLVGIPSLEKGYLFIVSLGYLLALLHYLHKRYLKQSPRDSRFLCKLIHKDVSFLHGWSVLVVCFI